MMAVERGAARTRSTPIAAISPTTGLPRARGPSAETADGAAVRAWLGELSSAGLASATMARRLSAVRQLHRFLYLEGGRADDPTQTIEGPRRRRPLPSLLDQAEIVALIAAARERPGAAGLRLLACLELLYASGLRVSELVALPLAALAPDRRFLVVLGKGGKERMVPIGRAAGEALAAYLAVREHFLGGRPNGPAPIVFPSRARPGHLTRQRLAQLLQGARARGGHRARAHLAARAAPCVREPPAGRRRRSARRAD